MITSLTVDSEGIVSWTFTDQPSVWVLEQCFPNGSGNTNGAYLNGDVVSFNAFESGNPGGYNFVLYGLDKKQNLIIPPFISTDVSLNQ